MWRRMKQKRETTQDKHVTPFIKPYVLVTDRQPELGNDWRNMKTQNIG